jgi:hypothetical protein
MVCPHNLQTFGAREKRLYIVQPVLKRGYLEPFSGALESGSAFIIFLYDNAKFRQLPTTEVVGL